ncbi:unnamed protein product [Pseudo-nitzschia multistriata]|uniref:Uncharacterized protein n=1 Tax=Pseudo-nitzschia multistriata TaxID=183589 RepID=A0A448ZQF4_9STRA|nr:unnamed protein product [Pseudo-nitzschia multistriata]
MSMANAKDASSTGTSDDPIALLDEDNDDDDDGTVASIGAVRTNTNERKRPASPGRECSSLESVPRKRSVRGNRAVSPQERAILPHDDGCMLNPRHPIKIFATDRDKTTRRNLRRRLKKGEVDSDKDGYHYTNTEDAYRTHWSVFHCWTFREMLGFDRFSGIRYQTQADLIGSDTFPGAKTNKISHGNPVGIDWIFITTYILDVDYLLHELPELLDIPLVVIVYQYKDFSSREEAWIREVSSKKEHNLALVERNPRDPPRTESNPLKVRMPYGCHHTKMTLVGYSSGRLRVHIHTSNLRQGDVHDKCQGAFLQDFLPKTEDQLCNFVTSDFEESLVTYLESYHFVLPWVWKKAEIGRGEGSEATTLVSHIQTYDFSSCVGVLVPSVPGYHNASLDARPSRRGNKEIYGYLKVHKAIREHCNCDSSSAGPIVCQFSSMGALWEPYLDKVAAAWNAGAANCGSKTVATSRPPKKGELAASWLRFVWPTTLEVKESVEGPMGGNSVPGTAKNLHKTFVRSLLHKWRFLSSTNDGSTTGMYGGNLDSTDSNRRRWKEEDPLDKGCHVPHIKSYYQIQELGDRYGRDSMLWFVLSSHNMSVAAWGQIQNRQKDLGRKVLTVQHWELGIFLAPSTLGVRSMGPTLEGSRHRQAYNCKTANDDPINEATRAVIPLPFKFRPIKYQDSDKPWVVG